MIRVRLLTQVAAAGTAMVSLPAIGCAATHGEDLSDGALAETAISAGSGTLTLNNWSMLYASTSNGDEFLRVGERLTANVAFDEAVDMLFFGDLGDREAVDAIRRDPSKLKLTFRATYRRFDDSKVELAPVAVTFARGAGGSLFGTTPEIVIPTGTKGLTVDFVAEYMKNGALTTKPLLATHGGTADFVVFGAYGHNKLALFDTMGGDRRTRIVEGGGVVRDADLVLSVTDWRLDTIVERSTLDLRYGRQRSYSRFGPIDIDAIAPLDYVVSAVISTDGGATYQPLQLDKIDRPDVVDKRQWGRYAFQKLTRIAADAGPNVKIAFHIQAFLQVPMYSSSEITDARYSPGQRVLLKDIWDNNGGANYTLPISNE
jgi:hypothetical protein